MSIEGTGSLHEPNRVDLRAPSTEMVDGCADQVVEKSQVSKTQEKALEILGEKGVASFTQSASTYNSATTAYIQSDIGTKERLLRSDLKNAFLNCRGGEEAKTTADRLESILASVKMNAKLNQETVERFEIEWASKISNPKFKDAFAEEGTIALAELMVKAEEYSLTLDAAKQNPLYVAERGTLSAFKAAVTEARSKGLEAEDLTAILVMNELTEGPAIAKISYWAKKA